MPTPPLILYDNLFDAAVAYPSATITTSAEGTGTEASRVADYRRERSYWQPPTDGGGSDHYIRTYLGAIGAKAVDYIVIDRDSNLWGKTVYLEGSADGASWTVSQSITVPADDTPGGTPTLPALACTEEGVLWGLAAAAFTAKVYWRLRVPYTAAFIPRVTGLMVGSKLHLGGYSTTFDEDAGERTQSTQMSEAGYRGNATTYAWRTAELGLAQIGATEYDNAIRAARDAMFARGVPAMMFMDYATRPERGWLYEYDGARWGMAKSRVLRGGRIPLREVGHRLGY